MMKKNGEGETDLEQTPMLLLVPTQAVTGMVMATLKISHLETMKETKLSTYLMN